MTQEEKELLLKDLCARLPYGVFVGYEHYTDRHIVTTKLTGIRGGLYYDANGQIPNNELKPYLRPMSSMTEEEKKEFQEYVFESNEIGDIVTIYASDWLNAHYFDYRGLILKHLALEAPEGMYTHFGDMKTSVTVEYKGNKL